MKGNKQIMDRINCLRKAGKIAAQVRREGAERIIEGASYISVMDYCEARIIELGGEIAWAQMALNDCAAHFCPKEDDPGTFERGDLVKIDIGVHINGWLADNAMTVEVSTDDHTELILATQNTLKETIAVIRPGITLGEIGQRTNEVASAHGFNVIRNLSGHTIDQYTVHAGISIPAINTEEKTCIKEGMEIAIEPFLTYGEGLIRNKGESTIFMQVSERSVRSPAARKIMAFIEQRNGLPFCTKDLTKQFGKGTTMLGLRELVKQGVLQDYPPLCEVSNGLVAQFEHSMIVTDDGVEVITRHPDDTW